MSSQNVTLFGNREEGFIELGIWLSGLESFLASGVRSFNVVRESAPVIDSIKEFRLVHITLQRCTILNARLLNSESENLKPGAANTPKIKPNDLFELSKVLREATVLSEPLIHSKSIGAGEWNAWGNLLTLRFQTLPAFLGLIRFAEEAGRKFLPESLNQLVENHDSLTQEYAELALILPRFGVILKWLSVVGKMLEADEPLKPALLIFARVYEQIVELTGYINNRLERFPNEEAELFSSLDAASYTASIELKKVYSQELAGVAQIRSSPSIYARMETAYALLTEGFQQILAGFAQQLDPEADIFQLFPNFRTKIEQSFALRKELIVILKIVQDTELNPEKPQIDKLHSELREFLNGTARFLFYKDTETVERFIEEILVTKQNKDLLPILHRFGAYLETLAGQVSLRNVFEKSVAVTEPG